MRDGSGRTCGRGRRCISPAIPNSRTDRCDPGGAVGRPPGGGTSPGGLAGHLGVAQPPRSPGPMVQPDDPFADLVTQTAERPQTMIGAPTPTDEPLTLPARLIGTFPVDDTRRRLAPGPLTDHLLDRAADAYLRLIADVPPPERPNLLPVTGFPAGPVDGALRAAILERVRRTPLFVTAVGDLVTSDAACLLPGLGAVGAELLGQAIPGLLPPVDHAAATALRAVGMQTISWSQASSALAGIERDASFWWQVYEALSTAERPPESEDLADIPVPLTNGRRSIGARGCLLPAPRDNAEVDGQPSVAGPLEPGGRRSDHRGAGPTGRRARPRAPDHRSAGRPSAARTSRCPARRCRHPAGRSRSHGRDGPSAHRTR